MSSSKFPQDEKKPTVKKCKCGKPVETKGINFEYDYCYKCWWDQDPRRDKRKKS